MILLAILNLIIGVLLTYFGYQIKFKGNVNLINNFDSNHINDKKGYANLIGSSEFFIGIAMIILGITCFFIEMISLIALTDIILIISLIFLLIKGEKKYRG